MLYNFANEIKVGDTILTRNGLTKIVAVGIVPNEYIAPNDENNPSDIKDHHQSIKVEWKSTKYISSNVKK